MIDRLFMYLYSSLVFTMRPRFLPEHFLYLVFLFFFHSLLHNHATTVFKKFIDASTAFFYRTLYTVSRHQMLFDPHSGYDS